MIEPLPTWSAPLHQTALRALIGIEAIPLRFAPHESVWMLDASRNVVLLYLPDQDADTVEAIVTQLLDRFPQGGADMVVLGGGEATQAAVKKALPGFVSARVGATHVSDAGAIWTHGANSSVAGAMKRAFADGVQEPFDVRVLAAEIEGAHASGQSRVASLNAFAAGMKGTRPVVTIALLAVMIAIFAAEYAIGHASTATLVRMGACIADRVKHGEVWRLLSSAMLHASFIHILFNGASLLSLGSFYERLIGAGRYLVLFVAAAIGGGLACVLFTPHAIMVGASGAILGLLGASAALALRPGDLLPQDVLPGFRRNVGLNVALMLMYSMQPGISLAAHLGGLVVGFALMITGALVPRGAGEDRGRDGWRIPGGIAVALLLAAFVTAQVVGRPRRGPDGGWSQRALAGTPFAVRLPSAPHAETRTDGVLEFTAGDVMEDGYVLSVLVVATDPLATDAERMAMAEAARAQPGGGLGHPENTTPTSPPTITSVGGFPVLTQLSRGANGAEFRNWLQFRPRYQIGVQVVSSPDATREAEEAPRRVLESASGDL